jgi:hypothetical protein
MFGRLKLKKYFGCICVKDRKKKEGKRGEEGETTTLLRQQS